MRYRTYGRTGWQVSEIGFGGMMLGGATGAKDMQETTRLLLTAFEKGINFVDTAAAYGGSEERIGRALAEWKHGPIYVATKAPPVEWPHPGDDNPTIADRYPQAHLRKMCEESLRKLGVEAIDLYQLHGWFPRGIEDTEWYDTLKSLQREGKIREIGVSIRDYRPEDGIAIAQSGMIVSEQIVYNLFEQRPAQELFPTCASSGVAVLARVPFDEGALVGSWTKDTYDQFDPNDFRRYYFKGRRFGATLDKVEQIKRVVRETTGDAYANLAEVALRFCLSNPHVSCVIPGMSSMRSLEANIRLSDGIPLPQELLDRLQPFNWPRNYYHPDVEVDPI